MMLKKALKISVLGTLLAASACKKAPSTGPDSSVAATSSESQSGIPSKDRNVLDAQEFYEISKSVYLKKMRSLGTLALSDAEQRFFEKFQINPESIGQVTEFTETMFELLESGRYGFRLKAIPLKTQVSRAAPEGLSDGDLRSFYEMIKMHYFKRVTKRPSPEMDERERNFFEKIQKNSLNNYDTHDDYLLITSDLFDMIEGIYRD